jgi:phospholipase C
MSSQPTTRRQGILWRWSRMVISLSALSTVGLTAAAEDQHHENSALHAIKHIIVVYQENWSFDSLYGLFPGANGIKNSSPTSLNQTDRFDLSLAGQAGAPFSLVSGALTLTTPPQPG